MRPVPELLVALRARQIQPADLHWREFQEVVYQLVSAKLRLQFPDSKVWFSDNDTGIIDIIVEYLTPTFDLHGSTPSSRIARCFIECKRYARHLELDSAAKAFCAAIHERPRHLCLVTLNGLSPQAWDYARHFFSTAGADRPLTEVEFDHALLGSLLGHDAVVAHGAPPPEPDRASAVINIDEWQLLERGTFHNRVVATTITPISPVHLQVGHSYYLRVWASHVADGDEVWFSDASGERDPRFKRVEIVSRTATQIEVQVIIDLTAIESGHRRGPLTLEVRTANGPAAVQVPFPDLETYPSSYLFDDLRPEESRALAARLGSPDGERITFVLGEGGIGKSYLCERATSFLVHEHRFTAHLFSVLTGSEHLVLRIALALLRPHRAPTSGDEEVLHGLLDAWMRRRDIGLGEQTRSGGLSGEIDAATVSICAGLLTESPRPRVIYLQNCQDLAPREVKELALFVSELESRGWGGVRLLLESRTGSGREHAVWDAFVQNTRENIAASGEVRISRLQPAQVETGVRAAFLTDATAHVTVSLMTKAGGNPLYLTQVMRHLTDLGACRRITDTEGRSRFIIDDHVQFERRLEHLPERLDALLRRRLEQYLKSEPDRINPAPMAEYIALLAAAGPEFNRDPIARALGLMEDDLADLDWRLVRDGFLVHAPNGSGLDFVHDLMRIAASLVGRVAPGFARASERLERSLDQNVDRQALLAGTLNLWMLRHARALRWFQIAYERARQRADYTLQREALIGSEAAAAELPSVTLQDRLKRIDLLMALGWNEMQVGSQSGAVEVYRRAHRYAAEVLKDGGPEERRVWRHEDTKIRHRIISCLLHIQRIPEALDLLGSVVDDIVEVDRLFHVLNRYIRFCGVTNHPEAGWVASRTASGLAELLGPECISIIMSDAGHLHALESPERTLNLWKRGLSAAQDQRQKLHSRTNVLIGSLFAGCPPPAPDEFDSLSYAIRESGITGQFTRLYLYAGVRDALSGDWDAAVQWFEKALASARLRSQVTFEWQACCNLGVASVIGNDPVSTVRYFSLAAGLAAPLLSGWDRRVADSLAERFNGRAWALCRPDQQQMLIENPLRQEAPPTVSGVYWRLLHNVARLQTEGAHLHIPQAFGDTLKNEVWTRALRLVDGSRNALAVQTRHERLSLVLE